MKRISLALLFVFVSGASIDARLTDGPDHTILWNRLEAIIAVDDFVIGIAPRALVVCRYDDTLSSFAPVNLLLVDYSPVSLRNQDSVLLVESYDRQIVVYDLRSLPEVTYLGTIDPGINFADYALLGRELYLSNYVGGIRRYVLEDFSTAAFADSSVVGVLVTQIEIENDTLYALDEKNGILRYDLSGDGFGRFLDYLWVPFVVTSFAKADSLVVMASASGDGLIGMFGRSGSGVIDTIPGMDYPLRIYATGGFFAFVGYRHLQIVNRTDYSDRQTVALSESQVDGDVLTLSGSEYLLLPGSSGGLMLYDLAQGGRSRPALYPAGPISAFVLHNGKLFVGGARDPIGVFAFDSIEGPKLAYTIYDALTHVRALNHNGDSLIVYYGQLNRVTFINNSCDPDSFYMGSSIIVEDTEAVAVEFATQKLDTVMPVLVVAPNAIQAFAVTDSSGAYYVTTWPVVGRIASVAMRNAHIFVSTEKNQLWISRVSDSFELEPRALVSFAGRPQEILTVDSHLLVFVWDELIVLDYSDTLAPPRIDTVVTLPVPVVAAVLRGGKLYTTGPSGVGIYHMDGYVPEMIDYGGRGGSMIDVEGSILATSDGGAMYVYRLPPDARPAPEPEPLPTSFALAQNYPNPFNAGTVIEYSVPVSSHVELVVYNILGQRVRTLVDSEKPAGDYTIHWDGTDFTGATVATGVYFYQLRTGDVVASRKMLLLK